LKIDRVAITGGDNATNPEDLIKLSEKYPFIEWGILFISSRVGTNRYPSEHWISTLSEGLNLSAHLCGQYARTTVDKGIPEISPDLLRKFQRFQININFNNACVAYDLNVLAKLPYRLIFQYKKGNELIANFSNTFDILYDASGGLGKQIDSIQKPFKGYTGYAGGISPDNIDSVIEQITNYPNDNKVWIDMESGVRTNDELDLQKVEFILERVSRII
jgi:hypothetical protein